MFFGQNLPILVQKPSFLSENGGFGGVFLSDISPVWVGVMGFFVFYGGWREVSIINGYGSCKQPLGKGSVRQRHLVLTIRSIAFRAASIFCTRTIFP